jgi:hypothetical protein
LVEGADVLKKSMIDPPSGWRYGFPKEIPQDQLGRVSEWLLEQGYPKWLLESFGDKFRYRMWETDE